ncbi:hypothetical protein [Nocardia terpenica]|uniref:Ig-like domain-containing protein n=1 Tax=Nocardia terpenica TaxID=455432 RepID=A0A164KTD8_9NOCA|nr:hypothetical protein [Nocardia terpenica]KZM71702.1 hypothetical protein AWN90_03010 [Nocardia terpenica]NQE90942.1 hypothetical protein [Nocardia terpenica]
MIAHLFRIASPAIALAAATALLNAPAADADVVGVTVIPGPDGLLIGCSYTVVATVTHPPHEPGAVAFFNDQMQIPGWGDFHPDNGTVTTTWMPQRTGGQNITAVQTEPDGFNTRSYTRVDVIGTGLDTGSGCARTS